MRRPAVSNASGQWPKATSFATSTLDGTVPLASEGGAAVSSLHAHEKPFSRAMHCPCVPSHAGEQLRESARSQVVEMSLHQALLPSMQEHAYPRPSERFSHCPEELVHSLAQARNAASWQVSLTKVINADESAHWHRHMPESPGTGQHCESSRLRQQQDHSSSFPRLPT
jgi:hypothetical protein